MQSSYLNSSKEVKSKKSKKLWDDAGYEEPAEKKGKKDKKDDYSKNRKNKRGDSE